MINQEIKEIIHNDLLEEVLSCKNQGCRLVQICATKIPEGFELSYSFAVFEKFLTLRLHIAEDVVIPSITTIFAPAFLYENEMKDLFGVKIEHISVDYGGNFYRTSIKTPFNPQKTEGGEL